MPSKMSYQPQTNKTEVFSFVVFVLKIAFSIKTKHELSLRSSR